MSPVLSNPVALTTSNSAGAALSADVSSMDSGTGTGSMESNNACQVSMLWNWYTIDTCFLTPSWRVTSRGTFAGSCVGVVALVLALEFLRRSSKKYDRYLTCPNKQRAVTHKSSPISRAPAGSNDANINLLAATGSSVNNIRHNPLQQSIRAMLHMLQFALAYVIMLLAMSYNGYILISICIGAFAGYFIFEWEAVTINGPKEDATGCCG